MKKKIIFITVIVLLIILGVIYNKLNQVKPTEYSRTYYVGYVMIEHFSLEAIAKALEKNGCIDGIGKDKAVGVCYFDYVDINDKNTIVVYPSGAGMGPISFSLQADRLIFDQDISGKPDKEKCKSSVRQDLASVGNVVQIVEDTWHFEKIEYPWDVVY